MAECGLCNGQSVVESDRARVYTLIHRENMLDCTCPGDKRAYSRALSLQIHYRMGGKKKFPRVTVTVLLRFIYSWKVGV